MPRRVLDLVGPDVRAVLEQPEAVTLKSAAEMEKVGAERLQRPYIDPALQDHGTMCALVRRLAGQGMIRFCARAKSRVGAFCVGKKDGTQRLIFDCRPFNAVCRDPPTTHLATCSALCNLDFSSTASSVPEAGDRGIAFAAADLTDGFYQMGYP